MKSRPEVVITGVGAVSPAGLSVEQTWAEVLGAKQKVSLLRTSIGPYQCSYPAGRVLDFVAPAESKGMDRCVGFGLSAAGEAVRQAELKEGDEYFRRAGCVFSTSKPAPTLFGQLYQQYRQGKGLDGCDGLANVWPSACCTQVANYYGLIGPRLCVPTACSTGANAIIRGVGLIIDGQAECVVAGAAEACLTPLYLAAFDQMGVLAQAGDDPATACKPFDRRRSGFVVGEGGAAVVLESASQARRRGVRPLAQIRGYWQGMHSSDLWKLESDGKSLSVGIKEVLKRAGISGQELDYICAHGTGTRANDVSETAAIKCALGRGAGRVSISSHKGAIGHLLGAAGAMQAVLAVQSIQNDIVPPTVNLEEADPLCDLDYTQGCSRSRLVRNALCITAGFGGQCGLILLSRA